MNPRERMALLSAELDGLVKGRTSPIMLMEVCGTHTVNACRSGVHALMPSQVRLISGPGCPVCVTAQRYIDALVALGRRGDVTILTYGDMIRVAGAGGSLELARSEGADVRVVTSTLEAIEIARAEPSREMVFAAVGFETTAPATAAAILQAHAENIRNFSVLPCHKLVMPAMRTLLSDPSIQIDGFICPGHVSVIIGAEAYRPIVDDFKKPCVVTGFEALQIMEGVVNLVRQIVTGRAELDNIYPEVVSDDGNPHAIALIDRVFVPGNSAWRALGEMADSGLDLREEFASFDALKRFNMALGEDHEPRGCICAKVITGRAVPVECRLFGKVCTPVYPVGPCMVSSEGACQAWFKYRRHETKRSAPAADQPALTIVTKPAQTQEAAS